MRRAGVSPGTIWKIEGGKGREPHLTTMRKIADALGVHPSEIAELEIKRTSDMG